MGLVAGGGLGSNKHSMLSKAYPDVGSKATWRVGVMECGNLGMEAGRLQDLEADSWGTGNRE